MEFSVTHGLCFTPSPLQAEAKATTPTTTSTSTTLGAPTGLAPTAPRLPMPSGGRTPASDMRILKKKTLRISRLRQSILVSWDITNTTTEGPILCMGHFISSTCYTVEYNTQCLRCAACCLFNQRMLSRGTSSTFSGLRLCQHLTFLFMMLTDASSRATHPCASTIRNTFYITVKFNKVYCFYGYMEIEEVSPTV